MGRPRRFGLLALEISNQIRNFDLGYLSNLYLRSIFLFNVLSFMFLISLFLVYLWNQLGNEPDAASALLLAVFILAEDLNVFLSRDKEIANIDFSLTYQMSCDLALFFHVILSSNSHYQTSFRGLDIAIIFVPIAFIAAIFSQAWFPSERSLLIDGDLDHAVHFLEQITRKVSLKHFDADYIVLIFWNFFWLFLFIGGSFYL